MKQLSFLTLKSVFWIVLFSILLSSCVPQKKMLYMQVKNASDTLTRFHNERKINYEIQSGDNLYIRIVSADEKMNMLLNPLSSQYSANITSDASVYLNSYMVSENGDVDFPMVGKIPVKGKTVEEVRSLLQVKVDEYLKQSTIIVKLVNFNITLLGEVRRPGQYKIYQNNINIFEAVSMAGDLTDFANRSKVGIIRQTKEGSEVHYLDMTKRDVLTSRYFFLKPNDIVYVEPVKGKQFTFAQFPYAVVFTAISSTILLLNFLKVKK